jgi:ankyrin repeat protein
MHFAAAYGHTEIVKFLHTLKFFDIYAKDKNGWTALDWAKMNGRTGCILYLEYNSIENITIRNKEKADAVKREEEKRSREREGKSARKAKVASCLEQIQALKDFLCQACAMSTISSDIYAQCLVVDKDIESVEALNALSREDLQSLLADAGLPVKKIQIVMEKFGWTTTTTTSSK